MTTDSHLGVYAALDMRKWLNIQLDYYYNEFIPLLEKEAQPGDILIHLGDLFDNRNHVPIIVLNEAEKLLSAISKIIPTHIIIGNHDIYNKSSNEINTPKLFRHLENVFVYDETEELIIDDKKLVLMPWVENKKDQIEEIKAHPGDYLFCHSDLNGCRMHLNSVAHRNEHKIDVEEFSGYKHCFSGHIHIGQRNKNFTFIGAPYHMDRNDIGNEKGTWCLNLDSGKTQFWENKRSPQFKKFHLDSKDKIDLLKELDTSKDFIDVTINKSIITGERKFKKELYKTLEKGSFAKVEIKNDLRKEEIIEVDMDMEDIDPSTIASGKIEDVHKVVKKYIDITYKDTTKEGMVKILNDVINIHRDKQD